MPLILVRLATPSARDRAEHRVGIGENLAAARRRTAAHRGVIRAKESPVRLAHEAPRCRGGFPARGAFPGEPAAFPLPLLTARDRVEISTGDVEGALQALLAHGVPLKRLRIRPRNLEDLFLELTGRELRA